MFHAPLGGGNGQTQEARIMDPINSRGVIYVKILNLLCHLLWICYTHTTHLMVRQLKMIFACFFSSPRITFFLFMTRRPIPNINQLVGKDRESEREPHHNLQRLTPNSSSYSY